jgi:hypothetical protein
VRLLSRHLTPENHQVVLARARLRTRQQIEALVAELAPQPDVPSSVRKLPSFVPTPPAPLLSPAASASPQLMSAPLPAPALFVPPERPIVRASAPERYRVQFTIGEETHQKLRRLQDLLRREIPDGDPAAIFDRAVTLLLEKVEKAKLGTARRPQAIRPRTDKSRRSRYIPRGVKREVWKRDGGQCTFVAVNGRRCTQRAYIDLHHGGEPYARGGSATIDNISLHCWRHNQYEAELIFGPDRRGDGSRRPGNANDGG